GGAEFLETGVADLKILDAPAHLLGRDRLALPELGLRGADRLDGDDAMDHAAVVVDGTDPRLVLHLPLALDVDVLLDFLDHREVRARDVEAGGDVAPCRVARRNRIFLRAGPPHADDVIARESAFGC